VNGSGSRSLKCSPSQQPQQACSDRGGDPRDVPAIERIDGPQREPDAVQADRVVRAQPVQERRLAAAVVEIVFRVHLEKGDVRPPGREVLEMGTAQTDAGPGGQRPLTGTTGRRGGHRDQPFLPAVSEPPIFSHSPFGTNFHSVGSLSVLAWPAQE
jgi:hypothetical protein